MSEPQDLFSIVGVSFTSFHDLRTSAQRAAFILSPDEVRRFLPKTGVYAADPFVHCANGKQYLFFELLRNDQKGVIATLERIDETQEWHNLRIVLEEPWHLSYPLLYSGDGPHIYMTVESGSAGAVRLYRANVESPNEWLFERQLLSGIHLDPTLFANNGVWYMFTCTDYAYSSLELFYSLRGIMGPWHRHPRSPVIKGDSSCARPAGPVLTMPNGKSYRLAQDCSERYGMAVKAFEIVSLSPDVYEEEYYDIILSHGNEGWNRRGMHHLQVYANSQGLLSAVTDGYRYTTDPY